MPRGRRSCRWTKSRASTASCRRWSKRPAAHGSKKRLLSCKRTFRQSWWYIAACRFPSATDHRLRVSFMVRVWTPSRLHFGLLSLAADGEMWPGRCGEALSPARRFGGVGLMIESPGVQFAALEAGAWSAEGPLAERALAFANRFTDGIRGERPEMRLPPRRLVVERAPPEHVGLGVGTQLGLAVARSLAETWGLACDAQELAQRIGRGRRSALGVHGFARGGFLVESGKSSVRDGLAPLAARTDFPVAWRLVLATPREAPGLHGEGEQDAFARLTGSPQGGADGRVVPSCAAWNAAGAGRGRPGGVRRKPPRLQRPRRRGVRPRSGRRLLRTCASPKRWRFFAGKGSAAWARVRGGRRCTRSSRTRTGRRSCGGGLQIGSASGPRKYGSRQGAIAGRGFWSTQRVEDRPVLIAKAKASGGLYARRLAFTRQPSRSRRDKPGGSLKRLAAGISNRSPIALFTARRSRPSGSGRTRGRRRGLR